MKSKLTMFVAVTGFDGDFFRQIVHDSGSILVTRAEDAEIIVVTNREQLAEAQAEFPLKGFILYSACDSGKGLAENTRWVDGFSAHMFGVISDMTLEQFFANCRRMNRELPLPEPMFPAERPKIIKLKIPALAPFSEELMALGHS